MNFEPNKVRRDFVRFLRNMEPGADLEVRLDDGNIWFIMSLKWCPTAIAPYCIFSPISSERIMASDLFIDEDGVEFIDGNQRRGFYWLNVEVMISKRPKYPRV